MLGVYIQNCTTFSEAMNNLNFEVRIPEYYATAIPQYFTRGPQRPKPIVNGVEVSWDEYMEKHPDYVDDTNFRPTTIYKGLDMNMCYSTKNVPEIVDLTVNQVPFDIVKFTDLGCIIGIMDGYVNEVQAYEAFNTELKLFLGRLRQARGILNTKYEELVTYYRNTDPHYQNRPVTLLDILSAMNYHRG